MLVRVRFFLSVAFCLVFVLFDLSFLSSVFCFCYLFVFVFVCFVFLSGTVVVF